MYESHFQVKERPFEIEPTNKYLYQSETHTEALLVMGYALSSRTGISILTGGFGTGKSSIVKKLRGEKNTVIIQNTKGTSYKELLQQLVIAWGMEPDSMDAKNAALLERQWATDRCLLVIDEAQYLSVEALEKIRLLCDDRLCVFLVGTDELQDNLKHDDLAALRDRIKANCKLDPLGLDEMSEYIRHRVKVAGREETLFNDSTMRLIHEQSKGIPRQINAVCDLSMLFAFSEEKERVDYETTQEAIKEIAKKEQ